MPGIPADPDKSREADDLLAGMPENPTLSFNPKGPQGVSPIIPDELDPDLAETLDSPRRIESSQGRASSDQGVLRDADARQAEALGFTLLRRLGRGGMGEVWEAIQRRLWRIVAVKRLHRNQLSSTEGELNATLRAFQGEAMTAALLDHPNIVPVYDLGYDTDGFPMIAMKCVKGKSWDKLLYIDFRQLEPDAHLARHLPILVQVAQAVAFAHSKGVIHRDLKPSQVMVGEFGEVLLMDWGLAVMVGEVPRWAEQEAPQETYPVKESATSPAGTPGYMAPEQTEMDPARIGTWTDVYLLGGLLYEVMTGSMPHPGGSSQQAFTNASRGIIRSFDETQSRNHPEELKHIALSAMKLSPEDRPSAKQFLELLQDYLTGATKRRESMAITRELSGHATGGSYAAFTEELSKLGQAQLLWPANPDFRPLRDRLGEAYGRLALEKGDLTLARAQAERLNDAEKRNQLLADIESAERRGIAQKKRLRQFSLAIYVLVAIMLVGSIVFSTHLTNANRKTLEQLVATEKAKTAELQAKRTAQQGLEKATLLLANTLVDQNRHDEAVTELEKIPEENRGWEWGFVMTRALQDLWTIPFEYLSWSPSKNIALGFSVDGGFCALRAESGEVLSKLSEEMPEGLVVTFSRDESRLALAASNTFTVVFDTSHWEEVSRIDGATTSTVTALEFSPDGNSLAMGDAEGGVHVANLASNEIAHLKAHKRQIHSLYWGDHKLVSMSTERIQRNDPGTGDAELLYASIKTESQWFPMYSGSDFNRRYFAFSMRDGGTCHGEIDGGPIKELPITGIHYAFSRYKPWLIVSGEANTPVFSVWDVETGLQVGKQMQELYEIPTKNKETFPWRRAEYSELSRDESALLVLSERGYGLLTFPQMEEPSAAELVARDGVKRIALLPNGAAAWVVGDDGKTHIRMLGSRYAGKLIPGAVSSFSPNDQYTSAITFSWFEQRDVKSGDSIFTGGKGYNLYTGGRVTTDEKLIYITGYRGDVFTIEKNMRATSELLGTYTWKDPIATFYMHPDTGRLVILDPGQKSLTAYSLAGDSAEELFKKQAKGDGYFVGGVYSTDGKTYIQGTSTGHMICWDAVTGNEVDDIPAHDGILTGSMFTRDRKLMATLGRDRHIKVWDAESLKLLHDLEPGFDIQGAVFSGSGEYILAWPERGTPVIMEVTTGQVHSRLSRTDFPMTGTKFFANDTRIVSSSGVAARFWDPETGAETFAIDSGFGTLSTDGRQFIFKTWDYQGVLVDLAPGHLADLPGTGEMTYRDRLDLWLIERYRSWSIRKQRDRMPDALDRLASVDEPIVGQGAIDAVAYCDSILRYLPGLRTEEPVRRTMESLLQILLAQEKGFEGWRWCRNALLLIVREFPDLVRSPLGRAVLVAGAEAGAGMDVSLSSERRIEFSLASLGPMEAMAVAFEYRGNRDSALAVARRCFAVRQLWGLVTEYPENIVNRLDGTLPEMPPAALCYGPGSDAPPMVLEGMQKAVDAGPEDALAIEDAAWQAYFRAVKEYLDKVAPPLDWQAVIAEQHSATDWPRPNASLTQKEFGENLRKVLENATFDGRSLKEAEEDEARRFDELFGWKMKSLGAALPEHRDANAGQ